MTVNSLLNGIVYTILQPIVVLMFAVALVMFFWGIVQFVATSNTDEGRETGKKNIMYGIIGMFIMFSVYGIIGIISGTFGIDLPGYLSGF